MVVNLAKETALKFGNHLPTLIIEGKRESVFAQLDNVANTHEGRLRQMFTLGATLGEQGVIGSLQQMFYISEAWVSMAQKGEMLPDVPPSQDPKRKEVLVIVNFHAQRQNMQMVMLEMVRDTEGQLVALPELQRSGQAGEHAESPLVTAFVRGFQVGSSRKLN